HGPDRRVRPVAPDRRDDPRHGGRPSQSVAAERFPSATGRARPRPLAARPHRSATARDDARGCGAADGRAPPDARGSAVAAEHTADRVARAWRLIAARSMLGRMLLNSAWRDLHGPLN